MLYRQLCLHPLKPSIMQSLQMAPQTALSKLYLVLITLSMPLMTGCDGRFDVDYYEDVRPACGYVMNKPLTVDFDHPEILDHPDCIAALEGILPFDETWATVDPVIKAHALDGFQALFSLATEWPEQNRVLGSAPYGIPTSAACILAPFLMDGACTFAPQYKEQSINAHVFNYVVNRFHRVTYKGTEENLGEARFHEGRNNLFLFKPWFEDLNRATRAAVLVHEARHIDAQPHQPGDFGVSGSANHERLSEFIDPDLGGPYGLESIYLESVYRGFFNALNPITGKYWVTDDGLNRIMWEACMGIYTHTINLPPSLLVALEGDLGCYELSTIGTATTVLQLEPRVQALK